MLKIENLEKIIIIFYFNPMNVLRKSNSKRVESDNDNINVSTSFSQKCLLCKCTIKFAKRFYKNNLLYNYNRLNSVSS